LSENTDDLFVGKTLLHGVVLMWLMKTLLTSRCINQRGAGQWINTIINSQQSGQDRITRQQGRNLPEAGQTLFETGRSTA
ncbi:hypothetical protein, partial [Klebsiella pneumoniae]|uniref:hypothetical protein n=4 Tax=Klebsiella pneumoniae TaxID=573 RepID=UPI003B433C9C